MRIREYVNVWEFLKCEYIYEKNVNGSHGPCTKHNAYEDTRSK